jgi:hypothetical protein
MLGPYRQVGNVVADHFIIAFPQIAFSQSLKIKKEARKQFRESGLSELIKRLPRHQRKIMEDKLNRMVKDQRRPSRRRRKPAALECRAAALHLQVGGGDA